jgi:hypothetical protein
MEGNTKEIPELARIFANPKRVDVSTHYDKRMKKDLAKNLIRNNRCEECTEWWGPAEELIEGEGGKANLSNCYRFNDKPKHGTCPWFDIPVIKIG